MTQLHFQSGFADVTGARLYYEVAGEGYPLLLLHEGIADSRMWENQWTYFTQFYKVIRFDLPGFGKTEVLPARFSDYEQVAELLRFLHVERTNIVGASLGGRVALDFTLAHPEFVNALVLLAPSVGGDTPSDEVRRFNAEEEELVERGDLDGATELNLRMWVDGPKRRPEQVNPGVRNRVREMQLHAFTVPIPEGADEEPLTPPAITRLAEIKIPTLILVGDQDREPKVAQTERLAAEIPGARRVVIPGGGHIVSMEQPEAFNQVVNDFLRQV